VIRYSRFGGNNMSRKFLAMALVLAVFCIAAGCSFTTSTTNTFDKVKAGMTPEQVVEAMGETDSITKIELWRYQEDDTTIDISIQDGKVVSVRTFTVKSLKKSEPEEKE
jgi:hypothetical protein